MQYNLVEIRIHLEPLQEVLQKHFMGFQLHWLQSVKVGLIRD